MKVISLYVSRCRCIFLNVCVCKYIIPGLGDQMESVAQFSPIFVSKDYRYSLKHVFHIKSVSSAAKPWCEMGLLCPICSCTFLVHLLS